MPFTYLFTSDGDLYCRSSRPSAYLNGRHAHRVPYFISGIGTSRPLRRTPSSPPAYWKDAGVASKQALRSASLQLAASSLKDRLKAFFGLARPPFHVYSWSFAPSRNMLLILLPIM